MEIGSNLKLYNKKARFDSEKPFEIVLSFKEAEPLADAKFEPEEGGYTKLQLEAAFAANPLLLRFPSIKLYQMFPSDLLEQMRIKLAILNDLLGSKSNYATVEVKNGKFCRFDL